MSKSFYNAMEIERAYLEMPSWSEMKAALHYIYVSFIRSHKNTRVLLHQSTLNFRFAGTCGRGFPGVEWSALPNGALSP